MGESSRNKVLKHAAGVIFFATFRDCLCSKKNGVESPIGSRKWKETWNFNDIKSVLKIVISQLVHNVVSMGISWVLPLKISRTRPPPPELYASLIPACASIQKFPQSSSSLSSERTMHLVLTLTKRLWHSVQSRLAKTESSARNMFVLLSQAAGIGVYKSQQILNSGCITHEKLQR